MSGNGCTVAPRCARRALRECQKSTGARNFLENSEALELIAGAVPRRAGTWADLGAGGGTFTLALAERLGAGSRIYAVDRDARALARLKRAAAGVAAEVITVTADFTRAFDLPALHGALDGMLIANALHYARDAARTLARLGERLRAGGRLVLIEYDRRGANPWVPYPIAATRLPELAAQAGFSTPVVTARTPSAFGGDLYVAAADRLAPA
jgi:SAM-dependent methyltransferase